MNKSTREDAFFNWIYRRSNIQILIVCLRNYGGSRNTQYDQGNKEFSYFHTNSISGFHLFVKWVS